MKRLIMLLMVSAAGLTSSTALAQRPARALEPTTTKPAKMESSSSIHASDLQATPEMWFYEQQMLRYNNPQAMVHQNAAFDFAQRKQRIASQKWYGYSNSRPMVNSTPFGSSYGPTYTNAMLRSGSWARQSQIYVYRSNGY